MLGGWWVCFERARFSEEKWLSDRDNRERIVSDFAARFGIVGRTRASLVADLGEPDAEPYTHGDFVCWRLGPQNRFFPIDSNYLVVKLRKGTAIGWLIADDDAVRSDGWLSDNMTTSSQ